MGVTLVSHSSHPLGTLYYVWQQSRHNRPLPSPKEIENVLNCWASPSTDFEAAKVTSRMLGYDQVAEAQMHIREEVTMILRESIPVTENIQFVFHLTDIPISLREQMVRHRIGTKFGPSVGVDDVPSPREELVQMRVIPDLADSSWWAQTSRVVPFDTFATEGRYIIPDSLEGKVVTLKNGSEVSARLFYEALMGEIQDGYRLLMGAGVHIEDCRQVIPLGATHGITWSVNLKALIHILGKRSCWIAQAGLWTKIIEEMATLLIREINPIFRTLVQPMCMKKGEFVECPVAGTNCERVAGLDGMPPCPIWIKNRPQDAIAAVSDAKTGRWQGVSDAAWKPAPWIYTGGGEIDYDRASRVKTWMCNRQVEIEMMKTLAEKYGHLWGIEILSEE